MSKLGDVIVSIVTILKIAWNPLQKVRAKFRRSKRYLKKAFLNVVSIEGSNGQTCTHLIFVFDKARVKILTDKLNRNLTYFAVVAHVKFHLFSLGILLGQSMDKNYVRLKNTILLIVLIDQWFYSLELFAGLHRI
jgi:hypothetical protein